MSEIQREAGMHAGLPLLRAQKKPRRLWKVLLGSICLTIYFILSTAAAVLYGPFENLRRTVIGAVLTSRHPQYIEPFYSAATLKKYRPISIDAMSVGSMQTNNYSQVHDNGIEVVPISTSKYSGSLLIINDPKRVHVAVTKYLNDVGQTVSDMVKQEGAVAGINAGGFYDIKGHGTGGMPTGPTFSRGKYIGGATGSADALPMIGISKEGALVVGKYKLDDLKTLGISDAVSFGPQLVKDGQPYLKESDDSWGIAPRSAIGQRQDGAILLLALSGRGQQGIGASLLDCEEVMLENGAIIAGNLDGGYSTELYYKNDFLVAPSNPLGERYVATSFIVDGVKGQ
ncbi:phosphodiester glycosidase family protein [Aneurinibacillus sp. Ricciae_BoGa-3]|uniref:phosphodiester glycosidase family protein n=1 Tax=Aneurinibacillus sp. Ricciae_BoGa-3 TaxID=3022697 RepID=UPI0023400F20|nr:phosphodiester glycosidase family protein [Aneurinibacillus sp. Ricciae_BoGa-3]WCK55575.1 phosphodiester glycosidase family protein [Aneurinibacillus sp. Ricciae_BoGa-3]